MISLADSIHRYDVYAEPRIINLREIATELRLTSPVSVREVLRRLDSIPSELQLTQTITTDTALGGRASVALRSDGSYVSRGHMRATALPSFAFSVTCVVENSGSRVLPSVVHVGRVFGSDTPGERQDEWDEEGYSEDVRRNWLSVAENAKLSVNKEYNLSGVLGGIADIGTAFAEFVGLTVVSHPGIALAVLLGSNLGAAGGEPWPFPRFPVGVTIAGGVLLIFGPGATVPAILAGGVAENVWKHRELSDDEARFASKVFGNTLPKREQIILTNALGLEGRRFVIPGIGGSYLVNLGDEAFRSPMTYNTGAGPKSRYPQSGQLLIHELAHVWQAKRWPAATYFSEGGSDDVYPPGHDVSKPWSAYGIEQQATIVDEWYAADTAFLADEFQKPFPDFSKKSPHKFDRYMAGNVRAGLI